ncbi:transglutaminase domain-containing protein [Hymenobacter busanensis]|uniref:Transglutaminase domain-containing protein n=2 Tax=Hymenobacter busanensis TaxID=2607656 RepID=A0A7L5A1T2_9BACT|nr:transglutaminase domain-containing protein [Hymenobacter busanensis]QHJ09779.1 transglutaminase domain-containing protein [Hymenobacter busanensis]
MLASTLPSADSPAPRVRRFAFEYQTTVHGVPANARELDLWLPVPHADASQDIGELVVDAPYRYEILAAPYGNRVLHLRVKKPSTTDFTVTMRFQVARREHLNPAVRQPAAQSTRIDPADPNLQRWLAADGLVPLDDSIRHWARQVVAQAHATAPLDQARAIYNHVVSTVKYDKSGQGWGRGDIYYACDARRGNCTDFHALFIGYCRALGIPARFSIGFPLPPERGAGEVKGYHCWAEFYTPATGWVPIDASEAAKNPDKREYFFGAHDENRVEFTRGRDLMLAPRQQGGPLNYFIYPYAEVDGQPFTGLANQFRYHDATRE